ncbi:MAG: transketolase [Opitutaceae bacterium]|nr:transketolase [Opitutaceae bacterium]
MLDASQRRFLQEKARHVRREIVTMVYQARSGHIGGSLSSTEVVVALYHHLMRHDPRNPRLPDRDRFVLSKGHCSPVLYATLADCGYFPASDLKTFRRPGSHLQGHPFQPKTPGLDASTGTLGLGLSTACGLALAGMLRNASHNVFALCGDGEQQEGQIWEAALFAHKYRLSRLIAFTDRNRLQTDGSTESVMPLDPLPDKWRAFGWNVSVIDGHDFDQIDKAVVQARAQVSRPTMIIANTIKGRGVSFMENVAEWHGNPPNAEQFSRASAELGRDESPA